MLSQMKKKGIVFKFVFSTLNVSVFSTPFQGAQWFWRAYKPVDWKPWLLYSGRLSMWSLGMSYTSAWRTVNWPLERDGISYLKFLMFFIFPHNVKHLHPLFFFLFCVLAYHWLCFQSLCFLAWFSGPRVSVPICVCAHTPLIHLFCTP